MVVINQLDLIQELFTKRANNNNGRTVGYMARELYVYYLLCQFKENLKHLTKCGLEMASNDPPTG
jgi:hypothetical protein